MTYSLRGGRRFAGAERFLRVSQALPRRPCHRVRRSVIASRSPFHVLEYRHGLADVINSGAVVTVQRPRVSSRRRSGPARDHIGRTCAGRGAHRRRRGHAPRRRTSRACRRASPSGRGRNQDDHRRAPDGRPPRNPRSRARRCLRRDRGGATPPPRVRRRSAAPIAGSARVRRRRRPLQCCAGGIERPNSPCLAPSRSIRLLGRARRRTTTRRMKAGGGE